MIVYQGDIVENITKPGVDMTGGEITLEIVGKLLLTIFSSIAIGAVCGKKYFIKRSFVLSYSRLSDF